MILGLMGKARSGKDYCAKIIEEWYPYSTVRLGFADHLKEITKLTWGLSDEHVYGALKDEPHATLRASPRRILQLLGDKIKELDPEIFTRHGLQTAEIILRDPAIKLVIFADVRFQHDVDAIREGGGVVYRVERPSLVSRLTSEEQMHVSETSMDEIVPDGVLLNDGANYRYAVRGLLDTLGVFGDSRAPLPPECLVDAMHDRVHDDPGRSRRAHVVRGKK